MRSRDSAASFVDVAVIGAGITGLAAAHRLVELSQESGRQTSLVVLERAARAGGPIRTERHGETLIEAGPDQFVTAKPAAFELCRRLGLEHELIRIEGPPAPLRVLHRGEPVALPAGLDSFVPSRLGACTGPLFTQRGRARMALERFVPRDRSGTDESVASFVERRFGRELHERVVEPILGGIFTADTRSLSAEMALPRWRALERSGASLSRAAAAQSSATGQRRSQPSFVTLRRGLECLIERLVSRLPGSVHLRTGVSSLHRVAGRYVLELDGGRELHAGAVIVALPGHAAAALLRSLDEDLARSVGALDHASCATVSLLYPRSAVQRKLEGYGFFVPAIAGIDLLAVSYVNAKWPGRASGDRWLFRTFHGGARQPHALDCDDEALARNAHRALANVLGIAGQPEAAHVHRFPRAMPQYPVGFRDDLRRIEACLSRHEGLLLCGTAKGDFGIPDCVSSGEAAAQRAWPRIAVHGEPAAIRASFAG